MYKKNNIVNNINGDNMIEDIDFLNAIYENAKMGIVGIDEIKNDINGQNLLKVINEQKNDYYSICTKQSPLFCEFIHSKKKKNTWHYHVNLVQ